MTTAKTLTFSDIVSFEYPLLTVADNVYMLHDRSQFRDSVIELIAEFQKKIERPVIIMDGMNEPALLQQHILINSYPNLFFLIIPNQETVLMNTLGDDANWWTKTGNDSQAYLMNQWQYSMDKNHAGYLKEEHLEYKVDAYDNFYKLSGNRSLARKLIYRGFKNSMWVAFNYFTNLCDERTNKLMVDYTLNRYYDSFYSLYKDYFALSKEERTIRNVAKKFHNFLTNRFDASKYRIKSEIKNTQKTIREVYRRANTLEKEISDKSVLLRSLSSKGAKELKEFYNEKNLADNLKSIISAGKYTDIIFTDNHIVATTDMIEIDSFGKKYKIGRFQININCEERELFFDNLDYTKHHNHDEDSDTTYEHPHISNRVACFGNYKEHINKALVDGDYLFVLNTLIIFLKEYNDGRYGGAPFVMLEKYWGAEEDWNSDYELPTLDPRCIERVQQAANRSREYSARMLERIRSARASFPEQWNNLGDGQCVHCTENEGERYAAIVCYSQENCDRCSECGLLTDDCGC